MSRFYRELHDRELLVQAESILGELQRRNLLDVLLPVTDHDVFPRRLAQVQMQEGKLKLVVEENFFR